MDICIPQGGITVSLDNEIALGEVDPTQIHQLVTEAVPHFDLAHLRAWVNRLTTWTGICGHPSFCLLAEFARTFDLMCPVVLPARGRAGIIGFCTPLQVYRLPEDLNALALAFDALPLGEGDETPCLHDVRRLINRY